MNQPSHTYLSKWLFILHILFFISLIFSFRAVSSISIGLLLFSNLLYNKQQTGRYLPLKPPDFFSAACGIYFILLLVYFAFSSQSQEDQRQLILKTGLLSVPLAVYSSTYLNARTRPALLTAYSIILTVACLICISAATIQYWQSGTTSHFFYHQLVAPLRQHAVYFSILLFFALLFLCENTRSRQWILHPYLHMGMIVFLVFFLLLLSSKLVIIFFFLYILYFLITGKGSLKRNRRVTVVFVISFAIITTLLFSTRNPVSRRFDELLHGNNMAVLTKDSYQPGDYFNGLQFRLLQWKFVPAILDEQQSWWTGVGAAAAQPLLAQKYISKNMYAGKPGTADKGYLLYNTHNQLLESLLKNGIPGALCFLLIAATLLRLAWVKKNRSASFAIILLLLYCFSEALLETQYGILIFTFFPLFFTRD